MRRCVSFSGYFPDKRYYRPRFLFASARLSVIVPSGILAKRLNESSIDDLMIDDFINH
jgi:hypothetical protein